MLAKETPDIKGAADESCAERSMLDPITSVRMDSKQVPLLAEQIIKRQELPSGEI